MLYHVSDCTALEWTKTAVAVDSIKYRVYAGRWLAVEVSMESEYSIMARPAVNQSQLNQRQDSKKTIKHSGYWLKCGGS